MRDLVFTRVNITYKLWRVFSHIMKTALRGLDLVGFLSLQTNLKNKTYSFYFK